jgi:photosynthetic reaction center H subunit
MHPQFTPGLDVALLVFDAFVVFFIGLIFYLRREDRREGYPVEDGLTGQIGVPGGPLSRATEKTFQLPHGRGTITTPTGGRDRFDIAARPTERFHGAPLVPTGNPLVDGIGPAAWAERRRVPDLDMEGHPRIVPLASQTMLAVSARDPKLVGWPVVGLDHRKAGVITDLWVDRADRLVRYLQIELDGIGRSVLAPMMMAKVDKRGRRVVIDAVTAAQFADAPAIEGADVITFYEEERVQAYFGGGYLYATPGRAEPLL